MDQYEVIIVLSKQQQEQLKQVQLYVKQVEGNDTSGHGLDHLHRVTTMISRLVRNESAEEFIALLAGWLHDVIDDKLTDDPEGRQAEVQRLLQQLTVDPTVIAEVMTIITNMSFSKTLGDQPVKLSIEGQIVQDADRLDAIGALGIGRAFYYSGHVGEEMYDPQKKPRMHMTKEQYRQEPGTTINHFYEKLFKIYDMLNTESAKQIGQQRQQLMRDFVAAFKDEWQD